MLKHFILGVDFSDGWGNAEHLLSTMIETLGIEKLTLVCVDEIHRWQKKKVDESASLSVKLRQKAEDVEERFGVAVDYAVREGFPASELIKAGNEVNADGIIVTNQSHSVYRAFFLGNVALNLTRMAHVPVLILPVDGVGTDDGAPVLLGTDCSKAASKAEAYFEHIVESGVPGEVLLVDPQNIEAATEEDKAHAEAIAKRHAANVGFTCLEGDPASMLTEHARLRKARLLIMGRRGRSDIAGLPLGSTSETVCRLVTSPVMVVPQRIVRS